MKKFSIICLIYFLSNIENKLIAQSKPDTILLKNGNVVLGNIIGKNETNLAFKYLNEDSLGIKKIKLSEINRIIISNKEKSNNLNLDTVFFPNGEFKLVKIITEDPNNIIFMDLENKVKNEIIYPKSQLLKYSYNRNKVIDLNSQEISKKKNGNGWYTASGIFLIASGGLQLAISNADPSGIKTPQELSDFYNSQNNKQKIMGVGLILSGISFLIGSVSD